jgi:hypothetical protein
MRTHACRATAAAVLTAAAWLLAAPGTAGDDKVFKQFLPPDAYKELVDRAVKNIEEALAGKPSEEGIKKAQFNALMIAAYTLSADKGSGTTREQALKVIEGIRGKKFDAAKAAAAAALKGGEGKGPAPKWTTLIEELVDLMDHFRTKNKGGEGIPPALQSNIRLKGALNGIEEKLRALSMKQLLPAGATKEAEELALLGYRAAVVGQVTYYFTPKKNAKEWHELSLAMRDTGIALAQAAKKKDPEAIFKASNNLNSSCSQCHSAFRK